MSKKKPEQPVVRGGVVGAQVGGVGVAFLFFLSIARNSFGFDLWTPEQDAEAIVAITAVFTALVHWGSKIVLPEAWGLGTAKKGKYP